MVRPATTQSLTAAFPVRTKDDLLKLGAEWDDLLERTHSGAIFLSHAWMAEWWNIWGASHELFVAGVRDQDGKLVAIAPLYIRQPEWRTMGCRVLAFMASTGVASDHLDLLIEPGAEIAAIREIVGFLRAERNRWDYIELADADLESPILHEFSTQLRQAGMRQQMSPSAMRPYASLPDSFDEYLQGIGSSVRYNFRRRLRQLKEAGEVQFLCLSESADISARFDDLIQLHTQRFDHVGKVSAFLNPRLQAFHRSLLRRLETGLWPRLYLLRVAGRTVAALYGFAVGDRFSFYQSGMDPSWSRYSVGLVLLGLSIQHSIECGHKEFDFLRGTQSYKLLWAKDSRQGVTARFFDARLKSMAASIRFQFGQWLERLKRTLRPFRATLARLNRAKSTPAS